MLGFLFKVDHRLVVGTKKSNPIYRKMSSRWSMSLTIMIIKLIFNNPILGWLCLGPYVYFYLNVYTSVCEVRIFLILQIIGALYATKPGGTNLNFGGKLSKICHVLH